MDITNYGFFLIWVYLGPTLKVPRIFYLKVADVKVADVKVADVKVVKVVKVAKAVKVAKNYLELTATRF